MSHCVIEVPVRFADCDPAGIVFYSHYFEWFDAACWSMFEAAGFGRRRLAEAYGIVGWPLISTESQFRSPASEGDVLAVHATVAHWGNSSFQVAYRVLRGEVLVCEGFERRIWAGRAPGDTRRLQPMRIPDEVRARLEPDAAQARNPDARS
ncbi:MAG TPA: thioesterase family protein [Microvirga sp.]|nr:thioesterase family protein [Microvirga sp.]